MSIITKMRKQTAVYWAPGDRAYDNFGQPLYANPVEIACRWEDVAVEFLDANGNTQISRSRVYVDQDVRLSGVLMLGPLDDVTYSSQPKQNENAWEIRRFDKLPTLKATEFLRTAYL